MQAAKYQQYSRCVPAWKAWLAIMCLTGGLMPAVAREIFTLSWTNNLLTVHGSTLPGGQVNIWWLEALCRKGSTKRPWDQTTIPHKTEFVSASRDGQRLKLRTYLKPNVEVLHNLRANATGAEFQLELRNQGNQPVDLEWLEPCVRVDRFTGRNQSNYIERCFIFTDRGFQRLDQIPRNEVGLYRGGQVFIPPGINPEDVNPRPISSITPVNGLMGCFSQDNKLLLATAWNTTQHLFQGVIVCIHNDPHVGGLAPKQKKILQGRLYIMENYPSRLLKQYHRDFPKATLRAF